MGHLQNMALVIIFAGKADTPASPRSYLEDGTPYRKQHLQKILRDCKDLVSDQDFIIYAPASLNPSPGP
jgi:hypothetical protein